MNKKKPPKGELAPDWFCEGQESLLDLLSTQCEHCMDPRDTCEACTQEGRAHGQEPDADAGRL